MPGGSPTIAGVARQWYPGAVPGPPAAFTSRFASCTVAVIDRCMRAVALGGVLAEVDPDFSGHQVALIARDALEVVEAGDVAEHDLKGSDWFLSAVAEARFKRAHDLRGRGDADGATAAWNSGVLALEEIAASSNRSPALFYEEVFFEAAQSLARRGDRLALVRQIECLAEELTHTTEHNVRMELRDLALFYLELGDHGRGLGLLAETLRHDPADPWAYNVIALRLPRLGLPSLGRHAAQRGLELVRRDRDPERLNDQLRELLREIGSAEDRSDAPAEAIEDLLDALHTDFAVKGSASPEDLALRLVPELATARVKQLPPMPAPEVLADVAERLRRILPSKPEASAWSDLRAATQGRRVPPRTGPKIGRNDPCPCGSGKKYKKCCLGGAQSKDA
jgi:tetratricopeptide (TPR) repeat protein